MDSKHMDSKQDWRIIAEEVSKEMDPEKLKILVERLCKAFDEKHARSARV
jgi:hypothetical protein